MKEGYFELKKNKGLFALLWIGTAYMFFFMPISALYPLMSMGYFRGTPTHASIAEIAFAGGMLAGGILLSVWGGFKNPEKAVLAFAWAYWRIWNRQNRNNAASQNCADNIQ